MKTVSSPGRRPLLRQPSLDGIGDFVQALAACVHLQPMNAIEHPSIVCRVTEPIGGGSYHERMADELPLELIERQEWLEPVESGLQRAVAGTFDSAGTAGRKVRNFLHGVWLGHPLHPVLTDIPVGAWTAAVILDLVDERRRRTSQ